MPNNPQQLMSVLATLMLNNKLQQRRPVQRQPMSYAGSMPRRISANPPNRMAELAAGMLGGPGNIVPMPGQMPGATPIRRPAAPDPGMGQLPPGLMVGPIRRRVPRYPGIPEQPFRGLM